MADDIAAVILKLGLGRPVVFGHSAGGFVGLHLALRHAVAVGGLVLCNTTPTLVPFPDDDPPPGLAERATPEALEVAGRMFGGDFSPGWDRFISLVAPYYAAPNHTDVPQRVLELSAFAPEIAQHFFTSLAPTYDVRPRLGEIRVPTLVVVGRHDWVCRRAPAGDEHRRSPAGRARRRRAIHLRRGAGSLSGRGAVLPCHVAV
jgi:pimeloyl-ACP methyl ester carboxylesterase